MAFARIVTQPLSLQERGVLYAIRDFARFRRDFLAFYVHAAREYGVEFDYASRPNWATYASLLEFARRVMASIVGESNVEVQEPTMGAEDFAFMLQAKPGAYAFIANGDGDHRSTGHGGGPCTLHNPSYDFNDDLIPLGATYWVRLAESWLAKDAA